MLHIQVKAVASILLSTCVLFEVAHLLLVLTEKSSVNAVSRFDLKWSHVLVSLRTPLRRAADRQPGSLFDDQLWVLRPVLTVLEYVNTLDPLQTSTFNVEG